VDDFVVNVKQIGNYPATTTVGAADVLLLQQGGLGGDYLSILASDLVGKALSSAGSLNLAVGTGTVAWDGASLGYVNGSFTFSAPLALPALTVNGTLNATEVMVSGVAVADQDWVTSLFDALALSNVTTFNGRIGAVQLQTSDILQAGGAPIWNPHFGGVVTVPTVWDFRQNDDTVATTAWVQGLLGQVLCGGSLVTSFNGRGGAIVLSTADVNAAYANFPNDLIAPTAPNPASGDASNRIATTLFVDDGLADLQSLLPSLIDQELTTANFAPINSPNFTGVPTAPTAAAGSQTGQLATTAFVHNAVVASTTGVASFNTRTGAVTLVTADVTGAGGAPIASPVFTGNPTAPTPVTGNSSASIATTAFVMNELATLPPAPVTSFNTRTGAVVLTTADITGAGGAPIASPALTGTPTAPTPAQADSSTTLATTAFVHAAIGALGTTVQSFNGRTGAVNLIGNDISAAGGALLAGPAFTGAPTAPTAAVGTSNTQLATCAFVQNAITAIAAGVSSFNTRTGAVTLSLADITGAGGAPIASPNFTGTPTAPTPAQASSDTTVATTSFVKTALAAVGVSSFNSRTGAVTLQANDISAVGGALLAGPAFTGTPSAPTPTAGTNTTQIATTAFVVAALASAGGVTSFNGRAGTVTLSLADITGAGGAPLASPAITGTPTAPTPTAGDNSTAIATTAFARTLAAAPIASGSRVLLTTVTVSASAAFFSFFYNFTNAYDQYALDIYNVNLAAGNQYLYMRCSADGNTWDASNNYSSSLGYSQIVTPSGGFVAYSATDHGVVGNTGNTGLVSQYRLRFSMPYITTGYKLFQCDSVSFMSGGPGLVRTMGAIAWTYQPLGLRGLYFWDPSGNIVTATAKLYGIVK
jgi:hypothetical protein